MTSLPLCRLCKKAFRRRGNELLCSAECKRANDRNVTLRAQLRAAKRRASFIEGISFTPCYDVSRLIPGDHVVFGQMHGRVLAAVEPGDSIFSVWEKYCELHPEYYQASAPKASQAPQWTRRYIVLVEKSGKYLIRFPHLWNIKGIVNGSEESSKGKAEETGKAQKTQEA